jgi:antitoxin YefM
MMLCLPLEGGVVSITASEARRRLFPLIEEINNDRTAVEIVSKNGNAYLVAAEEYEALQETAYLLRSPANARRLMESYHEAVEGHYE